MKIMSVNRILTANSLQEKYPDISKEFHPSKNNPYTPLTMHSGSKKKIWWKCSLGHEFEARVENRTRLNSGCPYCSGLLATKENCLSTKRPDLLALWNYEKNSNFQPEDVKEFSNKKAWWKCSTNHEWLAPIARVSGGARCPYCSNNLVDDKNNLLNLYPEIAKEWHIIKNGSITANDVTAKSPKKYWWNCHLGHEWETSVQHRTVGKTNCPFCSNQKVNDENNVAVRFPEIIKQWDFEKNENLTPEQFVFGSNKKIFWKCYRGHSWKATIQQRTIQKTGCPFCRPNVSRLELRIYSELLYFFPDTKRQKKLWGKEFDVSNTILKLCIEVDGYPWHSKKIEKDKIKNTLCNDNDFILIRVRDDRLEKISSDDIFYSEKNRDDQLFVIQEIFKIIISKIDLFNPTKLQLEKYINSNTFINENEFLSLISQLPGPGFENSIEQTHPSIAAQWHPVLNGDLKPNMVSIGSGLKPWWICEKGHEWAAHLYTRTKAGCPVCSNKKVNNENSLSTKFPEVAQQWHKQKNGDLTPDDVVSGSGKVVWWQCEKGHEWKRSIEKRTNYGRGCPYCAGRLLPDISKYP